MKYKITISVEEELLLKVREEIRNKNYHNKSHAFENAMRAKIGTR